MPVIRSIQAHWPETRITWIIGTLEHKLLEGLEGVEFVVYNKKSGWKGYKQLARTLNNRHFDVLLHMQVALRANLLSRVIKAPIRLGWDRGRSRDFHHWFTTHSVSQVKHQHQVEGFLEFPRALGIPAAEPVWNLPIPQAAHDWAEEQLPGNQGTLVISPCSSHTLRNWSVAGYAQVADYAAKKLGMRVVISGGPSKLELETGQAIESAMLQPVLNLVGKDTLKQSMALLQRAQILISPDSGPAHLASALGTPVIGLHAATWSRRSGPYHSLNLCVDHFPDAARQFRNKSPGQLRWGSRIEAPGVMDLIQVDEVIAKLNKAHARLASN